MAALSPLPQGLGHVDPGWAHTVSTSALCLSPPSHFNCPPAGYVSGPDRLPDSGIYLAYWGREKASGYHEGRDKPFAFLSVELFAIYNDRHKWLCVAHHTTAHQSAAAGGTALSHHVIISQGRHRCPESERESANANQYFYSFLISTEAEHGFLYVRDKFSVTWERWRIMSQSGAAFCFLRVDEKVDVGSEMYLLDTDARGSEARQDLHQHLSLDGARQALVHRFTPGFIYWAPALLWPQLPLGPPLHRGSH